MGSGALRYPPLGLHLSVEAVFPPGPGDPCPVVRSRSPDSTLVETQPASQCPTPLLSHHLQGQQACAALGERAPELFVKGGRDG